jgi:general transcription factor IIIA
MSSPEDEEEEKDNDNESNDFSENDAENADTPNTSTSPSSPDQKRFPSEFNTYKCDWPGCTKTFNRPKKLETHEFLHKNERPHKCTFEGCEKSYMDKKHLQAHIKGTHTNERKYKCDWEGCGKTFTTGTKLRRHKEIHEGPNRHICTEHPPCNQVFRKHNTLERHIRSEHFGLAPFPCTYIDPDSGIQCDQGFDGSVGLRKHEQNVHFSVPQFFCPNCTIPNFFNDDGSPKHLSFKSDFKLQTHINKEHILCPDCDLQVGSKHALKKHIETQHSGISLEERKNILCLIEGCDKSFTKKSNLKAHIAGAHNRHRYSCGTWDVSNVEGLMGWDSKDGCGKQYVNKVDLENHVRTVHFGLPDLLKAGRMRNNSIEYDGEGNEKKKKGGTKPYKPSIADEICGIAYEKDPRRTIRCVFSDCPYKFIRDYDLQVHLRANSGHRLSTPDIEKFIQKFHSHLALDEVGEVGGNLVPGDKRRKIGGDAVFEAPMHDQGGNVGEFGTTTYDQEGNAEEFDLPDLPYGLEGPELDPVLVPGGRWWIGVDDGEEFEEGNDDFQMEEMEMRRLIDDAEFPQLTDPALEGF